MKRTITILIAILALASCTSKTEDVLMDKNQVEFLGTAFSDFSLTDDVTVTKKGEAAEVSDISEGDIVKLKYDENGELTSVKVSSGHKQGRKAGKTSEADSTSDAEQGATA